MVNKGIGEGYKPLDFADDEITGVGFRNKPALKGLISVGDNTLYFRSLIYNEVLMSAVNQTENFQNTHWGVKLISNSQPVNQSLAVREFLIAEMQNILGLNSLSIVKNQYGIPVLLNGGQQTEIPASLSHHENFVAYSFQLPNA
jgi:hypothetical protein